MSVAQTDFASAILRPDLPAPTGLVDPEGRPAGKRFDVYRNNVVLSLIEALEQCFPAIRTLVGEEFFSAMAGIFVRQHQPSSPLLMFYGEQMPEFLEAFQPVQHLGYLPELAKVELAIRHSYHATDVDPIDPNQLLSLPADQMMAARLSFAPSMVLMRSRWPLFSLWTAGTSDAEMPEKPTGEAFIITRADYDPVPHLLPAGGATFIAALQNGQTFGEAVETATAAIADFDLQTTLSLLIAGQAITGLTLETSA